MMLMLVLSVFSFRYSNGMIYLSSVYMYCHVSDIGTEDDGFL